MSGGYRKYLERLMPLLARDQRIHRLDVFLPWRVTLKLDPEVAVHVWGPDDASRGFTGLRQRLEAHTPDLVFVPTARYVDFGPLPVITMVHNMEPLTVPLAGHAWPEGIRNLARAWMARRACWRSSRIIAVSGHVRDFLVRRWNIDADRIGTIYHGVEPPAGAPAARTARSVVAAGSIRPARGLEDLIGALPRVHPGVRLEVAGQVDAGCEGYAARLWALAARLGVSERIVWRGPLDPARMSELLACAGVFAITSRAEACPMMALEALSSGCAIVAVDREPMPEVLGAAAAYYPLGRPEPLARLLNELLESPARRLLLSQAAMQRALSFDWTVTRDLTVQEFERALHA
jgi:glycosyltransferase involved in cell wall biosynthesis